MKYKNQNIKNIKKYLQILHYTINQALVKAYVNFTNNIDIKDVSQR